MTTYYLKLGAGASLFYDPKSKVKVTLSRPVAFQTSELTSKVREAISGGHLVSLTKDEFDQLQGKIQEHDQATLVPADFAPTVQSLSDIETVKDLRSFLETNYDLTEEERAFIMSNKRAAILEYVKDWAPVEAKPITPITPAE
jgi:hypothetical protein